MPLARDQDLRVDEGIDRFLQTVDFDLPFHCDHFFDDPCDGVAGDAVPVIDDCRSFLKRL